MKRTLSALLAVSSISSAFAAQEQDWIAARDRSGTLLKMEARSIKGLSTSQADAYGDQIITSIGDIVTAQLKKGMTCDEIYEFVNKTMEKSFNKESMVGITFQLNKFLAADCAIKAKSNEKTK